MTIMMKIRLKLAPKLALIFVVFALFVVLGLGTPIYYYGRSALLDASVSDLVSAAIEKQAALDYWVEERQRNLVTLAASPHLADHVGNLEPRVPYAKEPEALQRHFIEESDQPLRDHLGKWVGEDVHFESLMIIEAIHGQVVFSTDPREFLTFKENRPYFLNGRDRPFTSDLYYSVSLQAPTMVVSTPIQDAAGAVLGVLAGRLNLSELNTILSRRTGLHETDDAYLVNAAHLFVTQPRLLDDPAVLRRGAYTASVDRCLAGQNQAGLSGDYRDLPVIVVHRWLPAQRLCLIAQIDQAEAFGSVHALGLAIMVFGALILLVAGLIAILAARRIAQPVRALEAGASAVRHGKLDVRLPEDSLDEIGQLAREFNAMTEALRRRTSALEDSQAALAKAQALAHVGSWRWSIERGEMISGSPEYARIHGVEPDDVDGFMEQQIERVIHPEDRERFAEISRKVDREGLDYEIEYRILRADGEVRHVLEIGEAVYDTAGRPVEHVGTLQDITEQKQSEQALRESLEQLRQAQRIAKLDHWMWDAKANAITVLAGSPGVVSDNIEDVLGVSDEAYVERFVHPDDRERVLEAYGPPSAKTERTDVEYRIIRPDGEVRFVHEVGEPVFGHDGAVIAQVGTLQDITERERAEAALRKSETSLAQAQRMAHLGNWEFEVPTDELFWSLETYRIFGLEPQALETPVVGFLDMVHPDDRERVRQTWRRALEDRTSYDIVHRIGRSDGAVRFVHQQSETTYDEDGKPIRVIGTLQDITEQKQAEEEIRKLNEELEQRVQNRTAELQRAQEELLRNERLAALGQLTGTVSHELRNPLGAMRTAMATIKKLLRGDDPMLKRSIELVDRSILRCDNIIGELLDYSRVCKLAPEPTALDGWLAGLLDEYELPPGITLRRELRAGAVAAFDHDRLRRVVVNLLDNACQAMAGDDDSLAESRERLLVVSTRPADGRVEISISDTGPGIPAEAADRIFEPLYSTKAFGVGLGLPIVKQILAQHDGGLEVDRSAERGTRIIVWLPLPASLQRAAS
jgi:PAS domain S-box-containing protein